MKLLILLLTTIFSLFSLTGQDLFLKFCKNKCCNAAFTSAPQDWTCYSPHRYQLAYNDEFDGNKLNLDYWNILDGIPQIDDEHQYYSPNNISVKNGNLVITTKKQHLTNITGSVDGIYPWGPRDFEFTSGWIISKFKMPTEKLYQFGKIEARIKIQSSKDLRPAFWLYDGNPWKEIDIFEFDDPDNMGSAILYDSPRDNDPVGNCTKSMNDVWSDLGLSGKFRGDDDFHIYTCEWNPVYISIYVDNVLFMRFDRFTGLDGRTVIDCPTGQNVLQKTHFPYGPMEIKLNVKVKNVGDNFANVDNESEMLVDYVRMYYRADCTEDIVINDPSYVPNYPNMYNVLIGKSITFNCSYNLSAGNYLRLVASEKIILGPNFTISPNAHLYQVINPQLCLTGTEMIIQNDSQISLWNKRSINQDLLDYSGLNLKIYPNPISNTNLKIDCLPYKLENVKLILYDIMGKVVLSKVSNLPTEIEVGDFNSGIYNLILLHNNKIIKREIINVQN